MRISLISSIFSPRCHICLTMLTNCCVRYQLNPHTSLYNCAESAIRALSLSAGRNRFSFRAEACMVSTTMLAR